VLSACYVAAPAPPEGAGLDPALKGVWAGMEENGKIKSGAFLHFVEAKEGKPPLMVAVDDTELEVYETFTLKLKGKAGIGAFAVRQILPADKEKPKVEYVLGYYKITGDRLAISILDSDKVGAMVDAGKVKGEKTSGKYYDVSLTGTPAELASFLASPEASAAAGTMQTIARRFRAPR